MKLNHYSLKAAGLGLLLAFASLNGCKTDIMPEPTQAKQTSASNVVTFVHPGIVNTKTGLDWIRIRYLTGGTRATIFNASVFNYIKKLDSNGNRINKPSDYVNTSSTAMFYVTVIGGAKHPEELKMKQDGMLAYANALAWVATGEAPYLNEAKKILIAYGSRCSGLKVDPADSSYPILTTAGLEASWITPTFVAAAEIIRDYKRPNNDTGVLESGGWTSSNETGFVRFVNIMRDYISDHYVANADTVSTSTRPVAADVVRRTKQRFNSNHGTTAGFATMAIGVYLNNATVYTSGYKFLIRRLTRVNSDIIPVDGPTRLIQPTGYVYDNGNRDCDHFQYSLTAITYGAEIARNMGDNFIYNYSNSLLKTAYNYQYARRASTYTRDKDDTGTRCSDDKDIWPGAEVANRFYNPSNSATAYTDLLRAQNNNNTVVPIYSPNEPDYTFIGFTTFTHWQVPL